jgi:hypothetical protein
MPKRTLQSALFISLIISVCLPAGGRPAAAGQARETIFYDIFPVGNSEYRDMGEVEFRGGKANLVIFKTKVVGFKDTETIYSDPETGLPLRVERDVSFLFNREFLTEEYIKDENRLVITKFKYGGKEKVKEYRFKADGPIHCAVLLPFSLRKVPNLKTGWSSTIRLPDQFEVRLVGIEEVVVPAGAFRAYHFTSAPHKFEIWITADERRLPVKIEGAGGYPYTLIMKKHT